jgi:RHS repeat-associated protein
MDYDEFGRLTRDCPVLPAEDCERLHPFGFAGGLYDPDTELMRFGARDYDPQTGRWTAKDPIRFASGDSGLYKYTMGDPTNLLDATGNWPEGITRGDDPYLKRLRDTGGNRAQINAIEKEVQALRGAGQMSNARWKNIRAWLKLAKDGRLYGLLPCMSTVDCYCINNPFDCAELFEELGLDREECEQL